MNDLTTLKHRKGASVGTLPHWTIHSCPVSQQKTNPASKAREEFDFYGAGQIHTKDRIRLKNFDVPLISNSVETDKKNVAFLWHMLISQHPQDSKAPVHLAQFKHETDYKHRLEHWGHIQL